MSKSNRWIKLWAKTIQDPLFKGNCNKLGFWVWICVKAVTQDGEYPLGNKTVYLKRGQFIYGKKSAHNETGFSESTMYYWLKQFEKLGMIKKHPVNHEYTIVEVSKYKAYQDNYKEGIGHDINHVQYHDEYHVRYHDATTVIEDIEDREEASPSNEATYDELPPELESPFGQDPLFLLEQLRREKEREQNGN